MSQQIQVLQKKRQTGQQKKQIEHRMEVLEKSMQYLTEAKQAYISHMAKDLSEPFYAYLSAFNEGKYANKILKNKRISIILAMIINFVVTFIEVKFNVNYILISNNKILWNILQGSILIYYFILLILLSIRCIRKNKFIYTIFITTISIFTIRRIFYFDIFFKYSDKILEYNKMLTLIAYTILLIGLYIEVIRKIQESISLNNKVSGFDELKIKYKEIKEIEKAKSQFFANLSHEIKTPINIIYSCIQLLDINKKNGEK